MTIWEGIRKAPRRCLSKELGDISAILIYEAVDSLVLRGICTTSPLLRRALFHDNTVTIFVINVVSLYKMLFAWVLFIIITKAMASPFPTDRFSTFSPLYIDQNFEVSSTIIHPLLELDASAIQPLDFTTDLDIAQNSQSPPKVTSDDSYIKSQDQLYQSFRCGDEKSVCCVEETPELQGSIMLEPCNKSTPPFIPSFQPRRLI